MSEPKDSGDTGQFEVVIRFNAITGAIQVSGCDKNPIVSLGMLDYALSRVRRFLTMSDLQQETQNAPRIHVPERLIS